MNRTLHATCPTCGKSGVFRFSGSQHWPRAVASQHGLPEVISLWTCLGCQSTLSEFELLPPHTTVIRQRAWLHDQPGREEYPPDVQQ